MRFRGGVRVALVVLLALLVRLSVAYAFWGSYDVTVQVYHGQSILAGEPKWSTKLPAGYVIAPAMYWLSMRTGIPDYVGQKLPAIAGDIFAALLLFAIARRQKHPRPWLWPAIYLLNPVTVMLSAYHGNVDPLLAALMLWALDLRWRERSLAVGAVLAVAITIKPTAVLALPVLLLPLARRGVLRASLAVLLTSAAICLPFALVNPMFARVLITYSGNYGNWGIPLVLRQSERVLRQLGHQNAGVVTALKIANDFVASYGRYLLLAILIAWFAYVLRRAAPTTFSQSARLLAATYLLFYVFATGFGAQYLSLALPFLLIASVRWTAVYLGVLSPFLVGTFLLATLPGKYGIDSATAHLNALRTADLALVVVTGILSLAAWGTCAWILLRLWPSARASENEAHREAVAPLAV